MRTSCEVNFEKRGKLSDHVNCPVCRCCMCCCECPKPTSRFKFLAVFYFLLLPAYLSAAEIQYTYLDVGGQNVLQDINTHGDLAAETHLPVSGDLKAVLLARKGQTTTFGCLGPTILDDTVVRRINNKGSIAGACVDLERPNPLAEVVGFLRDKKGNVDFIRPPGSVDTEVYGLSDRDDTVGQWVEPVNQSRSGFLGLHGFLKRGNNYVTIDLPIQNTVTLLAGVNRKGKILVNYFFFDPVTNEMGNWNLALYDNGIYTPITIPGNTGFTYGVDINNDDVILIDTPTGNYIYDDGIAFKVGNPPIPTGYNNLNVDANGINDDGQLVGVYSATQICGQPPCGRLHVNFVATPN